MPPIYENPIFELQEIEQSGIPQTQSYICDRHFKRQISEEVKGIRSDRNHRHLYQQPPDYQTKFYSGNLGKTHKSTPQTNVCISENNKNRNSLVTQLIKIITQKPFKDFNFKLQFRISNDKNSFHGNLGLACFSRKSIVNTPIPSFNSHLKRLSISANVKIEQIKRLCHQKWNKIFYQIKCFFIFKCLRKKHTWLFATNREEKKHFKTRIRREESTRNHFRTNQDPEFQGNAS